MYSRHADAAADAAGAAFVRQWQPRMPNWLLMYSRHQRGLVAFFAGKCPPGGLVVEAAFPDELLQRINERLVDLWTSTPTSPVQAPALVPEAVSPAPRRGGSG
ncbi:MAG TPA: hypothetical protein VFV66_17060 [Nonomuraea sp.]|nr:hypothetical protein [Nonomuraea sp.]